MLQAIEAARESVLLEMYLVRSGRTVSAFTSALGGAARRGARVCVLFDGFGALGLSRADRRSLTEAGVQLLYFNPLRLQNRLRNLRRDHRKILVTDGVTAFVGGTGLTDDFAGDARSAWREVMVEIRGPVVADWQRAFAMPWERSGGAHEFADNLHPPAAGAALGRVALSDAHPRSRLVSGVIQRIDAAVSRAWIMSAYFVPSRRFRKALRRAARRGVDVRLLMPGPRTDHPWVRHAARRFYGRMLRNGVKIYEYQPQMLHAKIVLCDDWTSVGSSNMDRWSLRWNLEANQEVDDAAFAAQVAELFSKDIQVSKAISRRYWHRRGWPDRVREQIAGALDRHLDRWRQP
jgi:cardiolipin synthase